MKEKILGFLVLSLLLLTACIYDGKEKEISNRDAILLDATSSNWGLVESGSDYLENEVYQVKYNGELTYYETYEMSGKRGEGRGHVPLKDLDRIKEILEGPFQDEREDYGGADGTGWYFTYYDPNGQVIHEFSGYIYGSEKEEIIEILDKALEK